MKGSCISTAFKSGNISLVTDYHVMSITCIIPKLLESIEYSKVYPLFKHIVGEEQHGLWWVNQSLLIH